MKILIEINKRSEMEYPKLKETKTGNAYMSFLQLRKIKAKEVKDTIIAYDEDGLMINVDIDKNDKPCGVEIMISKEKE